MCIRDRLKRMIMDNCKEHYIVLDHTKFGDDSLSLIASTAELDLSLIHI